MVSTSMEAPVGHCKHGQDRRGGLIPIPWQSVWAGVFGHRPFAFRGRTDNKKFDSR